jgi:beta-lactamase superfamily II metal-dependent hydrolase
MDFSIDILNLGKADATIIWAKDQEKNFIIFLDGGTKADGQKIIRHYIDYILPEVGDQIPMYIINTHGHRDHIGGLIEIVHKFPSQIKACYYNNHKKNWSANSLLIETWLAASTSLESPFIQRIDESIQEMNALEKELSLLGIDSLPIFSDVHYLPEIFGNSITVIGPSKKFYNDTVSNKTFLEENLSFVEGELNEALINTSPCEAIKKLRDPSPDNKVSVILELNDSVGKNYLFTADASAPSFESAVTNNFLSKKYSVVQVPHHGSHYNIDGYWAKHFSPASFWIAAPKGDSSHPHQAVIACLRQAAPQSRIYSTHILAGSYLNFTTNKAIFPDRGLKPATTL